MSPRTRCGALATIVLALALTGCSSTNDTIDQALSSTSSAVASSQLGLRLFDRDRATSALTDTVLLDAAAEVAKAQSAVQELEVSPGDGALAKSDALGVIRDAIDAIDQAQQALADGSKAGLASATRQLSEVADELDGDR
jgi:ribosomal protein S11